MHYSRSCLKRFGFGFAPRSSLSFLVHAVSIKMVAKPTKPSRVPLAAREVHIIRRLKRVTKLPVTKIAIATQRNKTTINDALNPSWKALKRGPKAKLTKQDVNLLVSTAKTLINCMCFVGF